VHGPLELSLLLLLEHSLEILIHRAVVEAEVLPILMIAEDRGDIVEKFILHISELPREVHTCRDHDMIRAIVLRIVLETFEVRGRVQLDLLVVVEELVLNLRFDLEADPLVHATRSVVQLVHDMCENTMIA
jgi:hypothetical protein